MTPTIEPGLPKWIDDQKGKDPLIDDLIAYIEQVRSIALSAIAADRKQVSAGLSDEEIRFRFFKHLSECQRLLVFQAFGVYPDDCTERLNHSIESRLLDAILKRGSSSRLLPPDWVAVPREPTREMLRKMVEAAQGPAVFRVVSDRQEQAYIEKAETAYYAAIAAAPSTEGNSQQTKPMPNQQET
jgi:hypothetical protein